MMDWDEHSIWRGEPDRGAAVRSRALIAAVCLSGITALLAGAAFWRWLS